MKKIWKLRKLNDEPLRLDSECMNGDDEESSLFFEYNGVHHYWDDIVSRHSMWFPKFDFDLPDFIHGQDQTDYWNPLFVEVVEVDYLGYEYEIAFNIYELEVYRDQPVYHQKY